MKRTINKDITEFKMLIKERIEAKGVTMAQASILMGYHAAYLRSALNRNGVTVGTLLKIEQMLGVQCLHWGYDKVDSTKELKKPFLPKQKRRRP